MTPGQGVNEDTIVFDERATDNCSPVDPIVNPTKMVDMINTAEMEHLINTQFPVSDYYQSGVIITSPFSFSITKEGLTCSDQASRFLHYEDSKYERVEVDTLWKVTIPSEWMGQVIGLHLTVPSGLDIQMNKLTPGETNLTATYDVLKTAQKPINVAENDPLFRFISFPQPDSIRNADILPFDKDERVNIEYVRERQKRDLYPNEYKTSRIGSISYPNIEINTEPPDRGTWETIE